MRHTLVVAGLILAACCASGAADEGVDRGDRLRELRASIALAETSAERGDPGAEGRFRSAVLAAGTMGHDLLLARALDGLASATRASGRLDEAEALYRRAIPLWEELLGKKQPRVAVSLHNLAALRLEQGHPGEAETLFRQALEIWDASLGTASPQAVNTRRALAVAASAAERAEAPAPD